MRLYSMLCFTISEDVIATSHVLPWRQNRKTPSGTTPNGVKDTFPKHVIPAPLAADGIRHHASDTSQAARHTGRRRRDRISYLPIVVAATRLRIRAAGIFYGAQHTGRHRKGRIS